MQNRIHQDLKISKIALLWANGIRHCAATTYHQLLQRAGRPPVSRARRTILKAPFAAAVVLWLPRSFAVSDPLARPHAAPVSPTANNKELLSEQFRLQPPPAGYYGDGLTDTTAPVQVVLDRLVASGGGDIYFPHGDYPLNMRISGSRIRIICEKGTILRAAGPHPVIDILKTADDIEFTGPDVTGQTKAQEHRSTAPNVRALHCIRISGKNVTMRDFSTKAARADGIYIDHVADMTPTNITLEDFLVDSTSRNPVTIIAARNTVFNRGVIRLDGSYAGNGDVNNGYALFDLEPNKPKQKTRGIQFNEITFVNAAAKSGTQSIILGPTHNGTSIYDVDFINCRFACELGAEPAAIRLRPKHKQAEGLNIRNLVAEGRVFINTTTDGLVTIKNSRFEHITVGDSKFSYLVKIGAGCTLKQIKSATGKLGISGWKNATSVNDVMGVPDR